MKLNYLVQATFELGASRELIQLLESESRGTWVTGSKLQLAFGDRGAAKDALW